MTIYSISPKERFTNQDGTLTLSGMRILSAISGATGDDSVIFQVQEAEGTQGDAPELFQPAAVAALLATFLLDPTAANLAAALTAAEKTGTGALVFATDPTVSSLLANSGPIGYTTGAGGVVTQLVDKSTGVTLNEASGKITTAASALASLAVARFVVTNSQVAASDVPMVVIQGGGTASAYRVWVDGIGAGTFTVVIENRTAGSLSEALVLNFAITKGATS